MFLNNFQGSKRNSEAENLRNNEENDLVLDELLIQKRYSLNKKRHTQQDISNKININVNQVVSKNIAESMLRSSINNQGKSKSLKQLVQTFKFQVRTDQIQESAS